MTRDLPYGPEAAAEKLLTTRLTGREHAWFMAQQRRRFPQVSMAEFVVQLLERELGEVPPEFGREEGS